MEWDFETNIIDPSEIVVGSNKSANWICPKGHKYSMVILRRSEGSGCNICRLALRTSFPEQCFFFYTKKVYPDAVNSYREIFENRMELDIYIPSIRTGIEYDGVFWHDEHSIANEQKKYQICKKNNIRLFRIKEGDFKGFNDVADSIWYIPSKCDKELLNFYITEYLKNLTMGGKKLPIVDVKNDKNEILEFKTLRMEDSFAYQFPDIAKEWHPTKNGKLTPDLFTPKSSEEVWWLCPDCGNEWKAPIANRASGHKCNECANPKRMITRKQNILSKRGGVNKEFCLLDWDYQLNEYGPDHYTNGSGEIVTWRCHICGYRWETAICNRTKDYKNGCPFCAEKVIIRGFNDLPKVRKDLMEEWDYTENADIDPHKQGIGSHLNVSWICRKCGYSWKAPIYNRANGKGCPCCANRVVVPGKNDLATTDPDLAADWHPTKNTLNPTEVTRGQSKKVFWLCSKCGYEWEDTLNHRSGGRGCKECNKRRKRSK
jgi:rubrerythrin